MRLLEGDAEIFGQELAKHRTYYFPPRLRFLIFTYGGCELELNKNDPKKFIDPSEVSNDQEPRDHPIVTIANITAFVNELRIAA